jgi:hypothetical protein
MPSTVFEFMVWVVEALAPLAQGMVIFLFTPREWIPTVAEFSIANLILAPASIILIWAIQWTKEFLA